MNIEEKYKKAKFKSDMNFVFKWYDERINSYRAEDYDYKITDELSKEIDFIQSIIDKYPQEIATEIEMLQKKWDISHNKLFSEEMEKDRVKHLKHRKRHTNLTGEKELFEISRDGWRGWLTRIYAAVERRDTQIKKWELENSKSE